VNTTGWTSSAQSSVNGNEFVLTNPIATQSGYIYYATPQNLANCSQFTVSFEFKITNSSNPSADGIAFWYISNPPSAFIVGGGLGLPSNPNGLVLLLDTYNNDGLPDNNPLVSLRRFDGTANYDEGSTTGRLAPDYDYQNFIIDQSWHTCTLIYAYGTVSVSFDGNPPVMTGTTTLNINGYFGFSASTGALWAQHAIRNVTISGASEPPAPITADLTYCINAPAVPLTAPGANLKWYTSPTGGTALAGAPTPNTSTAGTTTWYVSEEIPGCNIESSRAPLAVTVVPLPEYYRNEAICVGSSFNFYGRELNLPGNYDTIIPAGNGTCDSLIKLTLSLITVPHPEIQPKGEIAFCIGEDATIKVTNPASGVSYHWIKNGNSLSGATNSYYAVNTPGEYAVVATKDGCTDTSDLVIVSLNPSPVAEIQAPEKDDFCSADTLTLNAVQQDGYEYLWTPKFEFQLLNGNEGSKVRGIFSQLQTKVILTVKNEFGCTGTSSVTVTTHPCCTIFMPTAFTPNQDGHNDYFIPILSTGQFLKVLNVYDRYGKLMYGNKTIKNGWDGKYLGKDVEQGAYMYYIEYTCTDGKTYTLKGDITVVR